MAKVSLRARILRWAFRYHERQLLGWNLFWHWHSRHSCAVGAGRPAIELTFRTSRPGRADNRIRNP